ncbi:MAG: CynX/NimT family MFS transporter [Bradyrhizobium sp.]|jgi:predicted MFS family arabinose efflux permease
MRNRWSVLALLYFVRATMAVQFQSVAAVAPLLGADFGVSLADIGILVGLYSVPGVALALPGGALGQRFGDKRTVILGLALMMAGSCIMAFSTSWGGQISGRVVAGVGGVLMGVLMTKMVADWFTGKELSTAMAIFVNSWPIGIAISLLALPPIGTAYGASGASMAVAALIAVAAGLLAVSYRSPEMSAPTPNSNGRLGLHAAMAVVCAGSIWGLYNIGFVMVFSFGPSMLVEHGFSITEAGSAISIVLWLSAISIPLGGVLADRTGRHEAIMAACFLLTAMLLIVARRTEVIIPILVALGMLSGLAAGPVLSLPARVLEPDTRAIGMGVFFSISYLGLVLGPTLGGTYATWAGSAGAAFDLGAAVLLICPAMLWMFKRFQSRAKLSLQPAA